MFTRLGEVDGRLARSERTKKEIIVAYILLARETQQIPMMSQVAARAGYSVRTVYMHFSDVGTLALAGFDYLVERGLAGPLGDKPDADREERIRFHVELRAQNCEGWVAMWRITLQHAKNSPEVARRVTLVRSLISERIQLMFHKELATLSETDRKAIVMALEALTDYESWGRMRDIHGLSYDDAREAWITAIDRLLPPTPAHEGARRE